jgi:hypothetical protein
VTNVALPECQIVHEIDDITLVGRVRRRDVWFAKLLQSMHKVFQRSKFGTNRNPVDVPIKEGAAGLRQPKRPFT